MRNTGDEGRSTWATYIKAARQGAGLSQIAFARLLDVDRATVYRWETGRTKPDDLELIQRIADVTGLDPDEVLAAAGLKLGVVAPAEPTRVVDEELERILTAPLPERVKRELLDMLERDRLAERQRRMERIDQFIRIYGRT